MQLLFYLGIILPTGIIIVAFIIFLICWFKAPQMKAMKKYWRGGGSPARSLEQPRLPLRRSVSLTTSRTGKPSDIFCVAYGLDDEGRPVWDKYCMRESLQTLYAPLPNSITFPNISATARPPPRSQTQQTFLEHEGRFARSTTCVYPFNKKARRHSRDPFEGYSHYSSPCSSGTTNTYGFQAKQILPDLAMNSCNSNPHTPSESTSESERSHRPLMRPPQLAETSFQGPSKIQNLLESQTEAPKLPRRTAKETQA